MIWFGRFNGEVIPNKQPRDLLHQLWKCSVSWRGLCYDKPEWININSFSQLLSLKFREQHTLQMVPIACGHLLLHLLPSAKWQTCPSSAAPGPAAGAALMPAAGFPWPGRCCCKPPVGFAFHFLSALDCVTKPPDSPPLTRMFYTTADQIQTTDMPFNRANSKAHGPPSQLRPGAQESKALFSLLKYEMKKKITWWEIHALPQLSEYSVT